MKDFVQLRCGGFARVIVVSLSVLAMVTGQTIATFANDVPPGVQPAYQAQAVVEGFSRALIGDEQRGGATYKERFDLLLPVFQNSFALDFLARATVGRRTWSQWSDTEQADYREVLARFLTGTMVRRIKAGEGYQFTLKGVEAGPRSSLIVRTVLKRDRRDDVELDYRLDQIGGRWLISDVFAESAVSEVALRRAEFSGTIRSGGQKGLIEALEEKISAFERDG